MIAAAAWVVLCIALWVLAAMTAVLMVETIRRRDLGNTFAVAYLGVIIAVIVSALVLITDWML